MPSFNASQELFAAMAYNAYRPSLENSIKVASLLWRIDPVLSLPERGEGFDATIFYSPEGKAIISFRGTDGLNLFDWEDNIQIARGVYSGQIELAIEVVADAIAEYGRENIQLTGHSLGGGLAGVMAVFFDLPAYVFAPAPFENTPRNQLVPMWPADLPEVVDANLVSQYYDHYESYQATKYSGAPLDAAFAEFDSAYRTGGNFDAGRALYETREGRVTGAYLDGEALEGLRSMLPTIGSGQTSGLTEISIGDELQKLLAVLAFDAYRPSTQNNIGVIPLDWKIGPLVSNPIFRTSPLP